MEQQPKPNSQAVIRQIREEIEKRKSRLAAEKSGVKTQTDSKTKPAAPSMLAKASKALGKAKSRLQTAKKWPGFLRHIRCNNYSIGQFLAESQANLIGEIKNLQKLRASVESKLRHMLHEHDVLIVELRETDRRRIETGSDPDQLQASLIAHEAQLQSSLVALDAQLQASLISLDVRLREMSEEPVKLKQLLIRQLECESEQFHRLLSELGENHQALCGREEKRNLALSTRLTYLEGAMHWIERGLVGSLQPAIQSGQAAESEAASTADAELQALRLDMFYLAFEDQFRGSRELIKERLLQYLPNLDALKKRIPDATALDVGCGRGEWLEVLRGYNINARGVDMNSRMAGQCHSLGLAVECGDGIAYIRKVPDDSLALVSGFHIVEHLELGQLLELIRQAHRVLKPGGIAIFETPNPEALKVSSYTFFFDPTHRNPLPPELLSFMGTHAGFTDVRVERFQPYVEDGKPLDYLDYACIFTK
jgi:O-antigen chain-terminating methyltransferase